MLPSTADAVRGSEAFLQLADVAERRSPPTSLEDLEISEHPLRFQTASQIQLHRPHCKTRMRLVEALNTSGDEHCSKAAVRLADCCAFPIMCVSPDGHPRLSLARCRHRLCPLCAKIRSRETSRRLAALLLTFNAPRFVTLTLKEDGEPLKDRVQRLADSFRKLRRINRWKDAVCGGLYTMEITTGSKGEGWHVHLHLIIDGEYYPQKALSDDWRAATGDSAVVDIRAIHDRAKAAFYIAKYISKDGGFVNWQDAQITEYATSLHRRRMVSTFGSAHGVECESAETPGESLPVESVCAVEPVRYFARQGNKDARRVLDYAGRLGPRWRSAFGLNPIGPEDVEPLAMTELDECIMVDCARRVAGLAACRKTVGVVPRVSRPPPDPVLFDTGHTPKR